MNKPEKEYPKTLSMRTDNDEGVLLQAMLEAIAKHHNVGKTAALNIAVKAYFDQLPAAESNKALR